MNESPNFLLIAILYGSLVIISLKYRHYKEKSERLEVENIKMATKLGKEVGVCEYCGEKMIKNMHNQKYHSKCNSEINKNRILALYHKTKKKVVGKVATLHNGVEVRVDTVFGKEIANKW